MIRGRSFQDLVFGATLFAAFTSAGTAPLPTGIKVEPFYDQAKVDFNDCKTIWMDEVPGFPKHFWVLSQEGQIFSLYPSGSDYAKAEIANFKTKVNFNPGSEYGAYNILFHPRFRENRKFYTFYLGVPAKNAGAAKSGGFVILDEWEAENVLEGKVTLKKTVFSYAHLPSYGTSKALFGPDGYVYLSISDYAVDGGNLKTMGRKLLRIDVDWQDPGREYGIPADNPYFNHPDTSIKKEIWAAGFRNAWSFTFDPWTRELWLADVGQSDWEELNIIVKGGDYAYGTGGIPELGVPSGFSGMCADSKLKAECAKFKDPAFAFSYQTWAPLAGVQGFKCIIAGRFFRGDPSSPFFGHLIFADHHLDRIVAVKKGKAAEVVGDVSVISKRAAHDGIAHIGEDSYGNLYAVFISWTRGRSFHVYRLAHPELKPAATPLHVFDRKGRWARRNARLQLNVELGPLRAGGSGKAFTLGGRALPAGAFPARSLYITVAQDQEAGIP